MRNTTNVTGNFWADDDAERRKGFFCGEEGGGPPGKFISGRFLFIILVDDT